MARTCLKLEALEDRSLPATFGIPWADTNLTLSFAPDGTSISQSSSNLFDSLNQVQSPEVWQAEILRAYQTWLQYTNLNLVVVADSGDPIGETGRWQGDPRFGDIRIFGTALQSSVLAIGTTSDPAIAGTRAGDVGLNTSYRFDGSPYDLYSVMLHEAGHSLGLANSTNSSSVMYTQYAGTRTGLSSSDISAIQGLYGSRLPDFLEGTNGNNSINRAYDIGGVPANAPETIQLIYGDLTTSNDVDYYSFLTTGATDDQNVTVKLQTQGFSLASAKLTIYEQKSDGSFSEVANTTMNPESVTGEAISVTFDPNDDEGARRYFIRVEKADGSPMSVGRYALAISFLNPTSDDDFSQQDLNTVWEGTRPIQVNADGNRNNTRQSATILSPQTVSQSGNNTRTEVLANLGSTTDRDFYRVKAPSGTGQRVLTVNVQTLDGVMSIPEIFVYNSSGTLLNSTTLVNGHGSRTVQITGLTAGENYFVRVSGSVGNYQMTADFGTVSTQFVSLTSGELPQTGSATETLFIATAQMIHFTLSADATNAPMGAGIQMIIRDSQGNIVQSLFAPVGQTVSTEGILFRPGQYFVELIGIRPNGWNGMLSVAVNGNRTDDPIGILPNDPTFKPLYLNPPPPPPPIGIPPPPPAPYYPYLYPGGFLSFNPFYWVSILSR